LPYSFYEDLLSQVVIGSKQISLPILIIHGDHDDIVPLSDIEAFSSSQSNVSLKIISGADHRFKNEGEIQTIVDITKTFLNI
jgi:dienelactone hydrolase